MKLKPSSHGERRKKSRNPNRADRAGQASREENTTLARTQSGQIFSRHTPRFFSFILGLFTPTGTTRKGKNFNPNVHIIPKLARGGDRVLISFTHTPLACRTTGYGNTPCPAQVVYSDIQ